MSTPKKNSPLKQLRSPILRLIDTCANSKNTQTREYLNLFLSLVRNTHSQHEEPKKQRALEAILKKSGVYQKRHRTTAYADNLALTTRSRRAYSVNWKAHEEHEKKTYVEKYINICQHFGRDTVSFKVERCEFKFEKVNYFGCLGVTVTNTIDEGLEIQKPSLTLLQTPQCCSIIQSKEGTTLMEEEEMADRWQQYVEEPYNELETFQELEREEDIIPNELGPRQ
ncbi:hypothetical protein FQA39_LY00918 [Lamprigera yunnana]|nr:hypothetical protein FQA39_LY00918 [Lamprigera yunnana]